MSERLRRQLSEASKLRTQQIPKIDRLQEIRTLLVDPFTDPLKKPELELESIWLRFKRGIIDAKTRRADQETLLERLETENPAARDKLLQVVSYDPESDNPVNRMSQIRDMVLKIK